METQHKFIKETEIHHARQNSRKNRLTDMFNRGFDMSDPLILNEFAKKRIPRRVKKDLPQVIIDMCIPQEDSDSDDE